MKAAFIQDFSGINGIEIGELPNPVPGDDEILIEVHYAGVNPVDWKIAEGLLRIRMPYEFPVVLGWDIAGKVVQKGSQIKEFSIGEEVFAYGRRQKFHYGGYADYIVLPIQNVAKKPKKLTMIQAAAVPLTSLTAWQSIFDTADLKKGETILIHGGSGGVGGMAVQLAKWKGAKVITTASKEAADYCRRLGADVVIDYKNEDFTTLGKMDVIFDTIGGSTLQKSYQLLKPKSRLVGIVSTPDPTIAASYGGASYYVFVGPDQEELIKIGQLFDKGALIPPHIEEVPFSDIKKALHKIKEGKTQGKLVIKVR